MSNTGPRPSAEVVQVYVHDVDSSLVRPYQELKGFAKVAVAPGETQRVTIELDQRAFSFWDPASSGWRVEPGEFEIRVGRSSRDIRATTSFILE